MTPKRGVTLLSVEDRQLIDRIRDGDEAAFDALFRRHYGALVAFAAGLLNGRSGADDVVQDVLLELWRRRDHVEIGDSARAYLFRSVRNRVFNELRHEGNVRRLDPAVREVVTPPDAPHADEALRARELERAIVHAIDSMRAPIRECFLMSRRDHLTYSEIASVLGVSVKTVEARMGQALRELRDKLASWMPG